MVAETFHLTDHTCHIKSDQGASRMFLDVVGNDPGGVMVNLVDQVVFEENTGGYFRTFFFEGFLAEGKHIEQFFQHLFYPCLFDQLRIDGGTFRQVSCKTGDAFGKITQAFQVRIDFVHGKNETQVDGDRSVKGDDIFAIAVYLQLESIHTTFAADHFISQFLISGKHRFAGII